MKNRLFGFAIGFINGVFGSGGGVAAVWFMEKFLNIEAKKSHATAVCVILPVSIVSAGIYFLKADIVLKDIFIVCVGGALGGIIGAKVLNRIPSLWLHRGFGVFLIITSIRMMFI